MASGALRLALHFNTSIRRDFTPECAKVARVARVTGEYFEPVRSLGADSGRFVVDEPIVRTEKRDTSC